MQKEFCSGFVSIIGVANVGKSTLINKFIGEKISATSHKAQTTRNKILGITTDENSQIIFLDTPGIHKPKSKLGEYMIKTAEQSLNEIDLILFLVEPENKISEINQNICDRLKKIHVPKFLVINKIDLYKNNRKIILKTIDNYKNFDFDQIIPISLLFDKNIDILKQEIKKVLPIGPKYFPDDTLTDQPERQIISELIREKILIFMQNEVPHGVAVEINQMLRKSRNMTYVDAIIYCEKETHKKILIGKDGSMLKKIGIASRQEAENLLNTKLNLKLWVKVKKNWRNNNFYLKQFGYKN